MNVITINKRFTIKGWIFGLILGFLVSSPVIAALNVAQAPLFLTQSARPIVLFNISNDHQLYFKAFDDYSDLNGDGIPETSYLHSFDYYGYFDSYKCYEYKNSNNRFEPESITNDKYCSGEWSGNFLNWASMARLDTIRKMLYGGFRSTDTASLTVLERTFIPTDAHSFAKFYDGGVGGSELLKLTPFTSTEVANGITLCNTTVSDQGINLSQNVQSPPLVRIAQGNFTLWASHERFQCQWRDGSSISNGTFNTDNGNDPVLSGINASNEFPDISDHRLGSQDFVARVQVCASVALIGQEDCKTYGSSIKPIGILQEYGDLDQIRFGLLTGSYENNVSGGVLRKNVSSFTDEVNISTDGTFKSPLPTDSIVNTLNSFRIYGYQYSDGNYFNDVGSDQCSFNVTNLTDATDNSGNALECTNWGNPQSEIYLESLRYLAGKSASPIFVTDDTNRIANLTTATHVDPIAVDQWCAPLNVIQFNASVSSYDSDELSEVSDIGITNLNGITDAVGTAEGIDGNVFFVGESGASNNQLCTAKTVTNLSSVRGTCPDAPRLQNSYHIAGMAHFAHTNSIRSDRQGDQLVTTYGVALTPSLPKADIPVPSPGTGTITILPACQNTRENTNCGIVDYKIVSQDHSGNPAIGRLYVNWETGEQGGDFDQDMWGILDYSVTDTQVTITTDVFNESTNAPMAFGYVINGTTQDGFHAHTGINGYSYTDPFPGVLGCSNCSDGGDTSEPATTVTYQIGNTVGGSIEQPLFYAAKYGGFIDSAPFDGFPNLQEEWDSEPLGVNGAPNGDGFPDRYFFAINPQKIADGLAKALDTVLLESGSAAAIATNSTRLDANSVIYQAKFNSGVWTGQLQAFPISEDGSISPTFAWDAAAELTAQGLANRNVLTYNPTTTTGVSFDYANLTATQQTLITQDQVEFLKGDRSQEKSSGGSGILRKRLGHGLLGDIINSDPWFIGNTDFRFDLIPPVNGAEATSYTNYRNSPAYTARRKLVAVGANDGMLHVFDGSVNQLNSGKEIFAFVPDEVLTDIADYTNPIYIGAGQHKYYVDGPSVAGDVYIDENPHSLTGIKNWRTVLVGTTGAGGKSIFALDVSFTVPGSDNVETEFLPERVLWEINTTTAPRTSDLTDQLSGNQQNGFANYLGLTIGQASIVRMANGKFAAVFGNGYNSIKEEAVLYIVDIETGELIKSMATGAGNPSLSNGLATPITIDVNADRVIDAIYAGDFLGNVWKFDVSDENEDNWSVAFGTPATPQPLYVAKDPGTSTNPQPITSKLQVGSHPDGGVMVYFGTGKYFLVGDNVVGVNSQIQTFYGIRDNCVSESGNVNVCPTISVVTDRGDLVQQTIDAEVTITTTDALGNTVANFDVRQTSNNPVNYFTDHGWFMDLVDPPYPPGTVAGEAMVSVPLLRGGRIIFITIVPDNIGCSFGGISWLMELDALTGKRLKATPFDITGDGKIDASDMIQIDTNGDSILTADEITAASGKKLDNGLNKAPAIIENDDGSFNKYNGGTDTTIIKTLDSSTGPGGRLSWVQIK